MFQRLAEGLNRTGLKEDRELAKTIMALLSIRGFDLELQEGDESIDTFTAAAREQLTTNMGYIIVPLYGKSIETLEATGHRFNSSLNHDDYPGLYKRLSRFSEVAICPAQLFLPRSNCKTLPEQLAMVNDFSREPSGEVEEVEAVIGEAPDYAELAFNVYEARNELIMSENFARTVTAVGHQVACVGPFKKRYGLGLFGSYADRPGPCSNMGLTPGNTPPEYGIN